MNIQYTIVSTTNTILEIYYYFNMSQVSCKYWRHNLSLQGKFRIILRNTLTGQQVIK